MKDGLENDSAHNGGTWTKAQQKQKLDHSHEVVQTTRNTPHHGLDRTTDFDPTAAEPISRFSLSDFVVMRNLTAISPTSVNFQAAPSSGSGRIPPTSLSFQPEWIGCRI